MLSKNKIKQLKSLQHKKFREQEQSFIAEGKKVIEELIKCKADFLVQLWTSSEECLKQYPEAILISEQEMKQISALQHCTEILAEFKIWPNKVEKEGLLLALDQIQDPGNLGTIIRTADWFGIKQIICSEGTVDPFNPKVVQATMGSLARINILHTKLPDFLSTYPFPIYGAFLDGNSIYNTIFSENALVIMGNEGKGISSEIEKLVTDKISIPKFGGAESLNVGIAAGIIMNELCRSKR